MKPITFLCACCLLLVSCGSDPSTAAPPVVPVPVRPPTPDISRSEDQVRAVEAKVDAVNDAVQEVGEKLEAATTTADAIGGLVDEAYQNGLDAGSESALSLKEFVENLRAELRVAIETRETVMAKLGEVRTELATSQRVNAELRSGIEVMSEGNKNLTARLEEANRRIQTGMILAEERDRAKSDLVAAEAKLKEAQKYKWGVWICITIIIAYVALKFTLAANKFTPQDRLTKFFF